MVVNDHASLSQSLRNQGFIRTRRRAKSRLRSTSLNPFEIRVSFELIMAVNNIIRGESQSLRNQGFIRTREKACCTAASCLNPFEIRVSFEPWASSFIGKDDVVSIPSKSGFHSNSKEKERGDKAESQSLRNQGFIRTLKVCSLMGLPTSQSLRNQGFIRTALCLYCP